MGNAVRYDGKGKFNQAIYEELAPFVEFLPICPEAAVGLGIPRPPVKLVQTTQGVEAIGRDDPTINVTAALNHFGEIIAQVHTQLCGYIFQSRSPSCGVGTTPIVDSNNESLRTGNGLVADKLLKRYPHIPIVNETDLDNSTATKQFIKQVQSVFQSQLRDC